MDLLTRMDGSGLQVEELGGRGWRWWWGRKGGGDGRKQESAATQAWWTVNEPGVTCLHSKVNLLTEHFCGLCYYYLLWLPCLCGTAQLLPYMELICHNTVKAGLVTEVSAVFLTANGRRVIRKQKRKEKNSLS